MNLRFIVMISSCALSFSALGMMGGHGYAPHQHSNDPRHYHAHHSQSAVQEQDAIMENLKKMERELKDIDINAKDTKEFMKSTIGKGIVNSALEKHINQKIKSALQKDAWSQNYIGNLYFSGDIVRNNPQRAAKWYVLSALQGNAESMRGLAILIQNKKYIPEGIDQSFADQLFEKANDIDPQPEDF